MNHLPRCFCLLISLTLLWLPQAHAAGKSTAKAKNRSARQTTVCQQWLKRLQRHKPRLVLPTSHRLLLLRQATSGRRPMPNRQHQATIRRYGKLRQSIQQMRRCFARHYRRSRSPQARRRLLAQAEQTLRRVLEYATLPLWLGTRWDYYGTATYPHQKKLACGYFVTHALRSVGFRFPQNFVYRPKGRSPMHIYEFAKQTGYGMLKAISTPQHTTIRRSRPPRALMPAMRRQGAGIYVLGLDNHVGLVLFDGQTAYFWHSGGSSDSDAWVRREPLLTSPQVVASGLHVLGKLPPQIYKRWLLQQPIRTKP